MKNFNNRYMCKNIHRYFTDISDISDISVKSNYRYIRVYRYFDPWLRQRLVMLRHNEIPEGRIMSRQSLLYRDTNSYNMEELVEIEKSTERRSSVAIRKFMVRQMTLTC